PTAERPQHRIADRLIAAEPSRPGTATPPVASGRDAPRGECPDSWWIPPPPPGAVPAPAAVHGGDRPGPDLAGDPGGALLVPELRPAADRRRSAGAVGGARQFLDHLRRS